MNRKVFALIGALSSATSAFAAAPGTQGGPQYGYCSAQTADQKKVYVSAVFEMALPDIQEHNRVMNAEFNKMLVQKYGSPAGSNEARSGGCTVAWYVSKAKAEEMRQIIVTAAHHDGGQVFDSGWTFVRTAQTPPPGPPVGGH
jgi:hypothetical protein